MKIYLWRGALCASLLITSVNAQTVVQNFEYASTDDLLAVWRSSGNAVLSVSDLVAPRSTGKASMKVEFNFPSAEWATETVDGPLLEAMLSIAPTQYVTFRFRGDPAFAASDFHNLYLYAYDEDGNFARWPGLAMPATTDWQIANFLASSMQLPWNSTTLPDLSRIVRFAFFQYGSQAAIAPYSATIYIDDLVIRNSPLTEFPAPSAPRQQLDDFETYSTDAALRSFYSYVNSPATTATTVSLATPAPQGSKALKLAIDFSAGQWPWGAVMSSKVAPFSLPTNAVVSIRFKGEPALAATADNGTTFWLSFYDNGGGRINFVTGGAPVVTADWTTLEARFADFGDTSTVDTGNLVQWRILVQGWQGTAESTPLSGAVYVDDVRITVLSAAKPTLSLLRNGGALSLKMDGLAVGKAYEVKTSSTLSAWTSATTINATAATANWPITTTEPHVFYQLVEKP